MYLLKKEDKVYLLMENSKTRKKSKKPNYIKIELFFIKAKKRTISYKLELFQNFKVYFVFYILVLELIEFKILI